MVSWTRRDLSRKASQIGETLPYELAKYTTIIVERLKSNWLRIDDGIAQQFQIEVFAFMLHLFDRRSFEVFGPEGRDVFQNELISVMRPVVAQVLCSGSSRHASFDWVMDTYNERQLEYGEFKKELPEKGEGLKGTLWWEFSKKMAFGLIHEQKSSEDFAKYFTQLNTLIMGENSDLWRIYLDTIDVLTAQ